MEHHLDNKKILIAAGGAIGLIGIIVTAIFLLSQKPSTTTESQQENKLQEQISTKVPSPTMTEKTVTYKTEELSVSYPNTWNSQLLSDSGEGGIQLFHPINQPEGYPYMIISLNSSQTTPSDVNAQSRTIGGIEFNKTRFPDSFIVINGEVQNETAQEIVYTSTETRSPAKIMYIYQGSIDSQLENQFEKVIDSIKFTN